MAGKELKLLFVHDEGASRSYVTDSSRTQGGAWVRGQLKLPNNSPKLEAPGMKEGLISMKSCISEARDRKLISRRA